MKIVIISSSVRESRATPRVAAWVEKTARKSMKDVELEVADLKELSLPIFDEPMLPMMNPERKPEGNLKRWLDTLESADGYIFVTPEYNHGMPAGLKSAIDYINFQIMKKPFMVVSHGVNGGARASEQLKQTLSANIGGVPVAESVTLNGMIGYSDMISEDGEIKDDSIKNAQGSLEKQLVTLEWYVSALKTAREQ